MRVRNWLGLVATVVGGCAPAALEPSEQDPGSVVARAGDDHSALAVIDGPSAIAAVLETGSLVVEAPNGKPFVRVGLRYDAVGGDPAMRVSVERAGVWSAFELAPITFNEGELFNAHLTLDVPAERVRVAPSDGAAGRLTFLVVELFEEPLPARISVERPEVDSSSFALAPPSLVHPRSAWGAQATPDCGTPHNPNYLTIHHTVTPNNDSTPPAQRIKGIQSYHINSNGWCDIGYHFLISQDGDRWQGWKTEQRSGIHTANHNLNNVGISFLGSYHIAAPPQAQVDGAVPLVKWMADTYGVAMNRTHVLGHGEWSGASTACPGSFLLSRLDEILAKVLAGDTENHVDIGVTWPTIEGQERDFAKGSSTGIFDVLEGQTFKGEVRVRNGADRPATDDVLVGYFIEQPYLVPVSYRIEHDLPSKDGQTFVTSPADQSAANPSKDALAGEGVLNVGVMQPGETVRVVFELRADEYSFGAVDHPDLRAWVKHIGGYYGEQDGWNDPVEVNNAGKILQAFAQLDVFSAYEWRFDGPAGDDLEGWQVGNDLSDLAVNLVDGALAMKASGGDPFAVSPAWTRIDADVFKEIRMRARQHGDARNSKLYFRRDGEEYSQDRALGFATTGGGTWDEVTLDFSGHPDWTGNVVGLRLDPWEGGSYDGAEAWYDVDWLRADGAISGSGGNGGSGAGWSNGGAVGTGAKSGSGGSSARNADEDGGCGCAIPGPSPWRGSLWLGVLFAAVCARRFSRGSLRREPSPS